MIECLWGRSDDDDYDDEVRDAIAFFRCLACHAHHPFSLLYADNHWSSSSLLLSLIVPPYLC